MRHIIPISGKDSLATAIIQVAREELDYEFMFNPTGQEYPEVYQWLDKVSEYFNKPIMKVGRPLKQIIAEQNWFLPSPQARYCTRLSKIEPMEKYLNKDAATVYFGIRSDEDRGGYDNTSSPHITPKYPLKELGITLPMVYQIVSHKDLKPPTFFWRRLWNEVTKAISKAVIATLPEWVVDSLFSWRSRMNCANCFFQRQYEWLGLLEHYPELFWEYEKWEYNVSEYFFLGKDKPLIWLVDNQDQIFKRRVDEVIKTIGGLVQGKLFFTESFDGLSVTSCGLYCGK